MNQHEQKERAGKLIEDISDLFIELQKECDGSGFYDICMNSICSVTMCMFDIVPSASRPLSLVLLINQLTEQMKLSIQENKETLQ